MSGIDGRLGSGLNPQSAQAFENLKARNQGSVTATDVPELQAAFAADGLDEEEQALLNALLAGEGQNEVGNYGADLDFNPQGFQFSAADLTAAGAPTRPAPTLTAATPPTATPAAPSVPVSASEIPTETGGATPTSIAELAHESNQTKFLHYAEQILHAKFGVKNEHIGALAKSLFFAIHGEDLQTKAQAVADIVVRLNELKETLPADQKAKIDGFVQELTAPLIAKLPANSPLRSIASKLFLQGGKSDGATRALLTVLNGKFDGLKEVKALYDLLLNFGPDIKALLPENAKAHIERLENLLGAKFGSHVQAALRSFATKGPNSDIAKATLKILTGDGVGKVAGGVDLLLALGQKIVGPDNKVYKAVSDFLKIDPRTALSIKTLLDPHAAPQLRAEALQSLSENLHGRIETVLEQFHPPHAEGLLDQAKVLEQAATGRPAANDNLPAAERPTAPEPTARPTAEPELRAANDNALPLRPANDNLPSAAPRSEVPRPTAAGALDNATVATERVGEQALTREARITATAERLGLQAESRVALTRILGNEQVDEKILQEGLALLERLGPREAETSLQILKNLEPGIARRVFSNPELGERFIQGALKMLPALERLGMSTLEILPKLAAGLGKAIPIAGAAISGYDAVRLGAIAATGRDLAGKEYKDPDVRALALLGAGVNGLDTALAVLGEGAGVGLLPQLGLAFAEVGIDLMVEYYNANPEKMPPNLRLAIKAAALGTAVGAPFALPGSGLAISAAVVNIYGLDGTLDIATELTRLVGETALQGIDKLHELQAKALDQGLGGLTDGINGLADVIRNPEKYASQLGKSVSEVISEAYDLLKNAAGQGVEAAERVYAVLKDIAQNPGAAAQQAVDFAVQTGLKIGQEVAGAVGAAGEFVKDMVGKGAIAVADGFKALYTMGAEGVQAAKNLIGSALRKGGQVAQAALDLARDLATNPGKYGEMAGQMAAAAALALRDAVRTGIAKAGDALVALKDMAVQGVQNAVDGIKSVVAAGGRMAVQALTFLQEAPAQVAEAIGEGLQAAYRTGKATLEMAKWVAQNPQAALQKLGAAGQQVLESTRDYLVDTAKNVKQKAGEALTYLEGLYNRTGAALGRFGDTLVDLMKQGVQVGQDVVGRYWDVIKRRGPELMSALGNLGQAGLDLMAKLGQWQSDAAQWAVDGLMNAASNAGSAVKSYALEKLNQIGATQAIVSLVNQGKVAVADFQNFGNATVDAIKRLGSPAALGQLLSSGKVSAQNLMNSLLSQGAEGFRKLSQVASRSAELGRAFMGKISAEINTAWQQTRFAPPDFTALRALINRYLNQAGQAGAEALRWVKTQLVNALDAFDKQLERSQAGNWFPVSIPDALINALR